MTLKNDANYKEELTCHFKIEIGIWRILTQEIESLKNLHFYGLFLTKVYNFLAKKVQRSYISWY